MEISKKILAVMRIIEAIPGYDRSKRYGYIHNANKMLDDNDRKVMTDVIKAMILLTAGNQKALRNPAGYVQENARDPYGWLIGQDMDKVITEFGLDIDLKSKPTKEDYVIAHKLLPIIGSSKVSPEELGQHTDMFTRDPFDRFGSEGHQKVYRGIEVSRNVILGATKRKNWNIGHGVSTSTSDKKGMEFAKTSMSMFGANGGPGLLLNIENKSKRGFHAGSLSRFPGEREVILSGMLEFGDWDMEFRCKNAGNENLDISVHSTSQIVTGSRMMKNEEGFYKRKEIIKLEFPLPDGTAFQEFVDNAVANLKFSLPNASDEWEVYEGSILLKMNAVLR